MATRDSYNINDIVGARPKPPLQRKEVHDQIFNDVTVKKQLNKEPHNPLNPSYKIRDEDGQVINYGHVDGSTTKQQYYRKNEQDAGRNLNFRDVQGNTCNTRSLGNFHNRERRQVRDPVKNDDIFGTQCGSLIHGIKVPAG